MKRVSIIPTALLILTSLLTACTRANQTPPIDAQATIDAALQATQSAGENTQATIDASVQATIQAQETQQAAIASAVQATLAAIPTPTAVAAPVYTEMSEEELSALIEAAVDEAMTDYSTATSSISQSTSDGTVTTEEATTTTTYIYEVYNEIAYAEELIAAYEEYYSDYAEEALNTLGAIEQDLSEISNSLNEIEAILAQGAEAATAAVDQLNTAVAEAQVKASAAQAQAQAWQQQVQTQIGERENEFAAIQPSQVAEDRLGALAQAHDFLAAFKTSLSDGKFSPDELGNISQLAANAKASLNKTGDPQMMELANRIDGLTRNAARGEWNQARSGLGDFEKSLPPRPRR